MTDGEALYVIPAILVGGIAFLIAWGYAVVTYGWFLGLGLGWFPALVIGVVVGAAWPLLALAVAGLVVLYIVAG